jgi:hypothetical protein
LGLRDLARSDEIDLDARTQWQGRNGDRRARGVRLNELLLVDSIYGGEVTYIGKEDSGPHDIGEGLAGGFENGGKISQYLFGLGADAPRHELSGCRIQADLTAEEEQTVYTDALGEWSNRRREGFGDDRGLAHGDGLRR